MYQQQRQQVGVGRYTVVYDAVHRKLRQVFNPFQSNDCGKRSLTSETTEIYIIIEFKKNLFDFQSLLKEQKSVIFNFIYDVTQLAFN